MSLQRLAIRVAAARALKGATLAEDRVFDSAIDPIDHTVSETRQPCVVVYTDEVDVPITGRDLTDYAGETNLVLEIAIASRTVVDGEAQLSIPGTDEGIELALDIIEHQALRVLTQSADGWGAVWLGMVPRITRYMSKRGASTEDGVRFAARQVVLTCDAIDTPVKGGPIGAETAWGRLLTQMEQDDALSAVAALIRDEIEGELEPSWKRAAYALGISLDDARSMGLAPFNETADAAETLEVVELVDDKLLDGVEITTDAAIEQGVGPFASLVAVSGLTATGVVS